MTTTWKDKNVVISAARGTYKLSGAQAVRDSVVSSTGLGYAPELAKGASNALRAGMLMGIDPLLKDATKKLSDLVAGHELPEVSFYDIENPLIGADGKPPEEVAVDEGVIDKTKIPLRMFNLTTGELETTWYNPNIEYCILSHSWKGCEIDYGYVDRLKKRDVKRLKCEELYTNLQNEVDKNPMQCAIAEFELKKYAHLCGTKPSDDVTKIRLQCDEDLRTFRAQLIKEISPIKEPTDWLEKIAKYKFAEAGDNEKKIRMLELGKRAETLLQQRKSADKIEKTVQWVREFYDKKIGPSKKKRYVWIDTCCINKGMVGEYQESIALMGEWYANADFCLVHLDTKPEMQKWPSFDQVKTYQNPTDPIQVPDWFGWWKMFDPATTATSKTKSQNYSPDWKANFNSFTDIKEPFWSTRGWTLQELALSKVVHFVNDKWEYLENDDSWSLEDAMRENSTDEFKRKTTLEDNSIERIVEFSNIPREEVCRGARKSKLPALQLIRYSSERNCTVATDQAYSLMGMLNVKFPGFSAEGLTKALSRLLDEVIITSNDVSVFNWAGKDYGSDIVGRSLYPKNFDAYKPPKEEDNKAQQGTSQITAPSALIKSEDMEIFKTYKELELVLAEVQDFVKLKTTTPETVAFLKGAIEMVIDGQVEKFTLDKMGKGHTKHISEIFRAIMAHHDEMLKHVKKKDEEPTTPSDDSAPQSPGLIGSFVPTFERPSLSKGFGGFGRKSQAKVEQKAPERPQAKKNLSERAIGSVGNFFRLTTVDEKTFSHYLEKVVKRVLDKKSGAINDKEKIDDKDHEEPKIDPEVVDELVDMFRKGMVKESEHAELLLKDAGTKVKREPEKEKVSELTKDQTISPNPIIVTSSGLEGVFDIQRVITTIRDKDGNIRKEIQKAKDIKNPNTMIKGECDISTGCAVVTVEFSCPAYILEKQLDVEEVVRKTSLKASNREVTVGPQVKSEPQEPVQEATDAESPTESPTEQTEKAEKTEKAETAEVIIEETEKAAPEPELTTKEKLKAEKEKQNQSAYKIQRMLAHVQQSDINLVAGEWVLARFSGVPSADWFLCQLELGSTHEFYGWRIPTDKINFHEARAEEELGNLWRGYMDGKKSGLCNLLKLALDKKKSMDDEIKRQEEEKKSRETGLASTEHALKGLQYLRSMAHTAWLNFEETHRTKLLRDDALQRAGIPKALYPAILTLDRSATLPAMYFASRQVHMF